jgi:hypothetical protein
MDVYGAFQLCAIGILTAPATVRLSTTYFNNPGRDLIFLWTVLLLAGLLSLVVEFMRLKSVVCPMNDQGGLEWAATTMFPYGSSCGMTCTPKEGPSSRLRQGSADNIYVVPTPFKMTFNTATLLAAGCCVPAILQLVSMWIKIMDANWDKFSRGEKEKPDETIKGTNGATLSQMTSITEKIRSWLDLIEIPVFAAAVLFILVKGEMNFWSRPVYYQTEQIASIGTSSTLRPNRYIAIDIDFILHLPGQWAPIVGTGLAVFGSLYLLISADIEAEGKDDNNDNEDDDSHGPQRPQMIVTTTTCSKCDGCAISSDTESNPSSRRSSRTNTNTENHSTSLDLQTPTRTLTAQSQKDVGGRRKVARFFNTLSTAITTKAAKQTEKSGFKREERTTYPTTPGEVFRNPKLAEDISIYNHSPTPMEGRSRAGSFMSSTGGSDAGNGNGNGTGNGNGNGNGEGSSRMARSRSPAPTCHSSLPVQMRPPPRSVTRTSHSNPEPEGGLFGSSLHVLGTPPSPGSAISAWRMSLSPVSAVTPESGRSRNVSVAGLGLRDTSATMSGANGSGNGNGNGVPTIHVSSHEGS